MASPFSATNITAGANEAFPKVLEQRKAGETLTKQLGPNFEPIFLVEKLKCISVAFTKLLEGSFGASCKAVRRAFDVRSAPGRTSDEPEVVMYVVCSDYHHHVTIIFDSYPVALHKRDKS